MQSGSQGRGFGGRSPPRRGVQGGRQPPLAIMLPINYESKASIQSSFRASHGQIN